MGLIWERLADATQAEQSRVVVMASVDLGDSPADIEAELELQLGVLRDWVTAHGYELRGELRLVGTRAEISDRAAEALSEGEGEFEVLAISRLHHVAVDDEDWQHLATTADWNGQNLVLVETASSPDVAVTDEAVLALRRACEGLS